MKIVWTNGCFDILHPGHVSLLNFAKSQGDLLIVGLDSDLKIAKDKKNGRPINSLCDRKYMLENLKAVDAVVSYGSRLGLERKLYRIRPDVMVVGSDYVDKEVVGSQYAKEVMFYDRLRDYSTTKIVEIARHR